MPRRICEEEKKFLIKKKVFWKGKSCRENVDFARNICRALITEIFVSVRRVRDSHGLEKLRIAFSVSFRSAITQD
jgi:hypothetical protein